MATARLDFWSYLAIQLHRPWNQLCDRESETFEIYIGTLARVLGDECRLRSGLGLPVLSAAQSRRCIHRIGGRGSVHNSAFSDCLQSVVAASHRADSVPILVGDCSISELGIPEAKLITLS